jgi:hypothetical protein
MGKIKFRDLISKEILEFKIQETVLGLYQIYLLGLQVIGSGGGRLHPQT